MQLLRVLAELLKLGQHGVSFSIECLTLLVAQYMGVVLLPSTIVGASNDNRDK
jgi:hypothetical protein